MVEEADEEEELESREKQASWKAPADQVKRESEENKERIQMEMIEKALGQFLAETKGLDPGSPEVQAKRREMREKVHVLYTLLEQDDSYEEQVEDPHM